jgi:hypothetical protein
VSLLILFGCHEERNTVPLTDENSSPVKGDTTSQISETILSSDSIDVAADHDSRTRNGNTETKWHNNSFSIQVLEYEEAFMSRNGTREVNQINDSLGFYSFIDSLNTIFSRSGFTMSEAENIYNYFERTGMGDGSYGMPQMPGDSSVHEVLPWERFSPKTRIQIKKIDSEKFKAFFWTVGCGRTFTYLTFKINRSKDKIESTNIEDAIEWRLSYPC